MEAYESNPRSRSMATCFRLWRQQRLKIIRLLLSVQESRYNERVGGPAKAIQGGCRRQCTTCGWPVGPTLKKDDGAKIRTTRRNHGQAAGSGWMPMGQATGLQLAEANAG